MRSIAMRSNPSMAEIATPQEEHLRLAMTLKMSELLSDDQIDPLTERMFYV